MYRSFNDDSTDQTIHPPGGASPTVSNASTCTSSRSAASGKTASNRRRHAVSFYLTPTPPDGSRGETNDVGLTTTAAGSTRRDLLYKVLGRVTSYCTAGISRAVGFTVPRSKYPPVWRSSLSTGTGASGQSPHQRYERQKMSMPVDRVFQRRHEVHGIYGQEFSHYRKHLPPRPYLSVSHATPFTQG